MYEVNTPLPMFSGIFLSGVVGKDRVLNGIVFLAQIASLGEEKYVGLNAKQRFKVVVINEAGLLSRDAQAPLRRTVEKYMLNPSPEEQVAKNVGFRYFGGASAACVLSAPITTYCRHPVALFAA
ncbi:hypothetical protein BJ322DRAFT_397405 [Thelephora terrestris]|uniref:Uncharacterized protein n=1 Tax=Thelephora terrestris TaxID=56493 RepID=A0A9P6LB56_9AGAM|nr:hypothetical protein BJ322DRAFT_397405 [Thelephora terrestris]